MSKIKVNTIAPRSGTTVTLGEAGDTIALGACASQTGFGRTGTVDWCTTVKTSPLTAVSGKGYFVNTCGGAVTVTLPASPSAGDIVSLKDYKDTWGTACKSVTLGRNSSKIGGMCFDASLGTEGQSVTMVYVDGTQGWENIQTDTTVKGREYICASGGNATVTCGDYKTHIFTADGCLAVNFVAAPAPANVVDYIVVAGGGSGGLGDGAGGGAGGFRYFSALSPAGSPLVAPAGLTVTATTFPITVGGGAAGTPSGLGNAGAPSVFSSITSAGGGGGGAGPIPVADPKQDGGSGGGGTSSRPAGAGNTPPVAPPQGQNGTAGPGQGGGGGGAGGVGGPSPGSTGGKGGLGSYIPTGFMGPTAPSYGTGGPVPAVRYFAGGAGGHGDSAPGPAPDGGGGGAGDVAPGPALTNGTVNTGGGGGGAQPHPISGTGGSGIVMIRYKYQ